MINREIQRTSFEQFEAFTAQYENQDRRFELINGQIVEKMPTEEHSIVTTNIYDPLKAFVKLRDLGRVLFEVRRKMPDDDHNAFLPDLEFTNKDRLLPIVRKGAVPQMPDLAIEIKSPDDSTLELREKAIYYLKNGARMVWLVFPAKKQVEVHTADSIILYRLGDILDGGDVLPGFALPTADIFADL